MRVRRLVSWILFGAAALVTVILVSVFFSGDVKGFGSLVFAVFFLVMGGWVIGDF